MPLDKPIWKTSQSAADLTLIHASSHQNQHDVFFPCLELAATHLLGLVALVQPCSLNAAPDAEQDADDSDNTAVVPGCCMYTYYKQYNLTPCGIASFAETRTQSST